jgi:excisionase family DNA binding protein
MPLDSLFDFTVIILFGFILSWFALLLATRLPSPDTISRYYYEAGSVEESADPGESEEPVEEIESEEQTLPLASSVQVPHIDLQGVLAGGGATDEACAKASGSILLKASGDPNDMRRYNRRLSDRRASVAPVGEDRRTVQRRVWLRREEDRRGKKLLTVSDAADTLGVPVEQIYKWLDRADIPFYQVTEGKKKAIRFEIDELLQWYGTFVSTTDDQ